MPRRFLLACRVALTAAHGQESQNPSPMVEHTRVPPGLRDETPPGRREKLGLGTLFLPAGMKTVNGAAVLFFFHGGTWLPEVAAAQNKVAVVAVQAGSGAGAHTRPFEDPARLPAPPKEADTQAGSGFGRPP